MLTADAVTHAKTPQPIPLGVATRPFGNGTLEQCVKEFNRLYPWYQPPWAVWVDSNHQLYVPMDVKR
jgi:hypothetical protein